MRFHFISGLPRSGSTLLAGILRQNPRFHAAISTPLASLVKSVIFGMSAYEGAQFIADRTRIKVISALVDAYYSEITGKDVCFDTNRSWCAFLPLIAEIHTDARVICCVRNPAWVLDSFERIAQNACFRQSRIFSPLGEGATVYDRVEFLCKTGPVGTSIKCLRQAWFGAAAHRLVVVRYESLTEDPAGVIKRIYDEIEEVPFRHDFENVEYEEAAFDSSLNTPGLHKISGRVRPVSRKTILPPDIFAANTFEFWNSPAENPHGVTVI